MTQYNHYGLCHSLNVLFSLMNSAMCVRAYTPVHALMYIQHDFIHYLLPICIQICCFSCNSLCCYALYVPHAYVVCYSLSWSSSFKDGVFILVNIPVIFLHMSAGGDGMESWESGCVTVVDGLFQKVLYTTVQARYCNKLGALCIKVRMCTTFSGHSSLK